MRPEDIRDRDFLVGLRGYERDEVRAFLAEVANEHGTLLAELDQLREAAVAPAPQVEDAPQTALTPAEPQAAPRSDDPFESLGASVASVLRAAQDSASEIEAEAKAKAAAVLDDAHNHAAALRGQAQALRDEAAQAVGEARTEAERILREAREQAEQAAIEIEARLANATEETRRREAAARIRLNEAADEIKLALLALEEMTPEPHDAASSNGSYD